MWIVEEKLFSTHKEASEYAKNINKTRALIEQIEPEELINPTKPTRVTHYESEFGMPLCSVHLVGRFSPIDTLTTVFPHRVNCAHCLEELAKQDSY